MYRWVSLNPNMDHPNSQLNRSPVEITCGLSGRYKFARGNRCSVLSILLPRCFSPPPRYLWGAVPPAVSAPDPPRCLSAPASPPQTARVSAPASCICCRARIRLQRNLGVGQQYPKIGNSKKKKKEIQFFSSKTCIVCEFWHFCSHLSSVHFFDKTCGHALNFHGKNWISFFFNSLFSGIVVLDSHVVGVGQLRERAVHCSKHVCFDKVLRNTSKWIEPFSDVFQVWAALNADTLGSTVGEGSAAGHTHRHKSDCTLLLNSNQWNFSKKGSCQFIACFDFWNRKCMASHGL